MEQLRRADNHHFFTSPSLCKQWTERYWDGCRQLVKCTPAAALSLFCFTIGRILGAPHTLFTRHPFEEGGYPPCPHSHNNRGPVCCGTICTSCILSTFLPYRCAAACGRNCRLCAVVAPTSRILSRPVQPAASLRVSSSKFGAGAVGLCRQLKSGSSSSAAMQTEESRRCCPVCGSLRRSAHTDFPPFSDAAAAGARASS